MSSMSWPISRKRLHSPDFRDDSDFEDNDLQPFKLRKYDDGEFPNAIQAKLKRFVLWIGHLQFPVKKFFTMAVKSGAVLPETVIIDDDDDEEEEEEEEEKEEEEEVTIEEVEKSYDPAKLAPLIEKFKNSQKFRSNNSRRQLEVNGSYSLGTCYDTHRINGSSSSDWNACLENGNCNLRQSRTDNLKRPALVSNPPTDIEILLESTPDVSAPEADGIEILSESPSTKQKHVSSQKSLRLSSRASATEHSASAQSRSCTSSLMKSQPSSPKSFTANEVVRLHEKAQYKLLLEKYINGPFYHHVAEQSDAGVQAKIWQPFSGKHFKKEVLKQPVDDFIQKYYKPCRLVSPEKAKQPSEKKKEPPEIKIDDDDDDDDVQILEIKLPKYKPKYEARYLTHKWLSELKENLRAQTEERQKIVEDQERTLERYRKERLLNLLRIDVPVGQAVELEFPELTPEMEEAVDQALNTGAPEDRLCKITSDYLLRKDIETLSGLKWLNDLVINSYFDLIVERSKKEGFPSVFAYNTFFYSTYKTKGYSSVRRWTRRTDIFSLDLNFVPIHLGVHWCLAVIDHRSKKICYYDSMGTGEEQCLDLLHDYLCLEYRDKKGEILDPSIYTTEIMKDIPQQMNGSDCGMFTLKYAEYISRDAEITFNQDHMQYFRRRMVYELLTNQLL